MAVLMNQIPTQMRTHLGILSGLQPSMPTPFRALWAGKPVITGNAKTNDLEWTYLVRKEYAAALKKKGISLPGAEKIEDASWRKVKITPGEISASQSITADELTQLQPDTAEVFMLGGEVIKTADQLASIKLQILKDSIARREEIMCAQLIKDGKVYFSNESDYYDFMIPDAQKNTYSSTHGFLVMLREMFTDYRKRTGRMPNKVLVGSDIVDVVLQDKELQETMNNMGYTNVAKDVIANNMALILGTFMGQTIEQMDFSFDEKGKDIVNPKHIKLIDTNQFRNGYVAIDVINPATNMPDKWLGDVWTDIEIGNKSAASAALFAKSGYFPIVVDPVSIQTWDITIA